jgi:hypothetical protein
MKMISAILVLLALVAAEPALAGCGSHGGGYSGGYGGYRARTVKAPVVVKKVYVQKRAPQSSVRTAAATTATVDKPETTAQVGTASTAAAESAPAKPVQSAASIACEEYSATVGSMIKVPCS